MTTRRGKKQSEKLHSVVGHGTSAQDRAARPPHSRYRVRTKQTTRLDTMTVKTPTGFAVTNVSTTNAASGFSSTTSNICHGDSSSTTSGFSSTVQTAEVPPPQKLPLESQEEEGQVASPASPCANCQYRNWRRFVHACMYACMYELIRLLAYM